MQIKFSVQNILFNNIMCVFPHLEISNSLFSHTKSRSSQVLKLLYNRFTKQATIFLLKRPIRLLNMLNSTR